MVAYQSQNHNIIIPLVVVNSTYLSHVRHMLTQYPALDIHLDSSRRMTVTVGNTIRATDAPTIWPERSLNNSGSVAGFAPETSKLAIPNVTTCKNTYVDVRSTIAKKGVCEMSDRRKKRSCRSACHQKKTEFESGAGALD